tara:strand:+ start:2312 stop:3499 length:1188 start_codon:yes stop_codon:yes gene_type:complete
MDKKNKRNAFLGYVTLWVMLFVPSVNVIAQSEVLSIEIDVSDQLQNSQVFGLSSLGLDEKGGGPVLISGLMQNLTSEKLENLYFEFRVSTGKRGDIISITQRNGFPFSLEPMQSVYVTNNALREEIIPGIEETMKFDGGLTPEGDALIEGLDGKLVLPSDTYSVQVIVFQISNALGRQNLAEASAEIGNTIGSETEDIFLRTPGDVIDGNVEITNPYPQFSWDGDTDVDYRLLVVNSSGEDSPESLLESAKSTQPITDGGSLLTFENLDVKVQGNTFQFPASRAQPLEYGLTYYWQLITNVQVGAGNEEKSSEIWSFKLAEPETSGEPAVMDNELRNTLIRLIGESRLKQLQDAGFTLQGLEMDGVPIIGTQVNIKITEFLRKIEDGDIILGANK